MKLSIMTPHQLTSCLANFCTVCLKGSRPGGDQHAVKQSWCLVCKDEVYRPVVQILVGHQLTISVEEDVVGDHLPVRSRPAHREVGGASCDCDISDRSRFCGKMQHQRLPEFKVTSTVSSLDSGEA